MHFQIDRDGQFYGPYTLEDLRRYVASGNVLPTDKAKSESMTEWLTVEQILASAAAAPSAEASSAAYTAAETPVYANVASTPVQPAYTGLDYGTTGRYAAPQGVAASAYPDAPNLHWGLVMLFNILTLGLFMPIWNFIVNLWLKKVQPNATSLYYLLGHVGLTLVQLYLSVPGYLGRMSHPHGPHPSGASTALIALAAWIVKLVWRYSERASLEEHFNTVEPMGLRLDAIMTFFFGGLYFQSKLNEINERKQRARFGAQPLY